MSSMLGRISAPSLTISTRGDYLALKWVEAGLSGLYDAVLRGTPLMLRVSPVEALRHWAEGDAPCAQSLPCK